MIGPQYFGTCILSFDNEVLLEFLQPHSWLTTTANIKVTIAVIVMHKVIRIVSVILLNMQIKLSHTGSSEYVIRTQPNEASLSTLESVAYALSWLEASPQLYDKLVHPMRTLCQYQLEHGAVVHHSKEHVNYKSRKLLQSVVLH